MPPGQMGSPGGWGGVMGPDRAPGLPPGKGPTSVAAPQGELPLSAIHINLEEKEKQIRSFLIEGGLCLGPGGRVPAVTGYALGLGALTVSVCQAPSSIPSGCCVPATRTTATGCSACRLSPTGREHPCCPAPRASRGCEGPPR